MNATKVEARPLRQRMLGVLLAPALVIGLAACDTQRGGFSADDAAAIRDQIEADRYLESKKASRKRGMGIRFVRLSPPGAEGGGEGGC